MCRQPKFPLSGTSVSGHLLRATCWAKPKTHTVLLKDHNDPARHGFIPTLQMATLRLSAVMVSDQDPSAGGDGAELRRPGPSCPTACCWLTFGGISGVPGKQDSRKTRVRGTTGHLWILLWAPGHAPQHLWVSVCLFVAWRLGIHPGWDGGSCLHHRPAPALFPGCRPHSSPRGLASQSKSCQPISAGRTRPRFLGSCGRIPPCPGWGPPLSPWARAPFQQPHHIPHWPPRPGWTDAVSTLVWQSPGAV